MLLIGGHQRSGTTLLRHLCHDHPEMAVTLELGAMLAILRPYRHYSGRLLDTWRAKITRNRVLMPPPWRRPASRMDVVRGHVFMARYLHGIRRYGHRTVQPDLVEKTLIRLLSPSRVVGDKWNGYVFALDELVDIEGIKIVVLYRDCRDVTSSFLKQARGAWRDKAWVKADDADTAQGVARRWIRAIESMERHAEHVRVIRYEDLARRPTLELSALAEWLGVDPAGFDPTVVVDTSIGRYRRELPASELREVIDVAGPTMARLGYH